MMASFEEDNLATRISNLENSVKKQATRQRVDSVVRRLGESEDELKSLKSELREALDDIGNLKSRLKNLETRQHPEQYQS